MDKGREGIISFDVVAHYSKSVSRVSQGCYSKSTS